MATFHLFGLIGNDMLWRSYEWVALSEVRAEAASARLAVDCMAHVGLGRDTPRSPILTAASSNDPTPTVRHLHLAEMRSRLSS